MQGHGHGHASLFLASVSECMQQEDEGAWCPLIGPGLFCHAPPVDIRPSRRKETNKSQLRPPADRLNLASASHLKRRTTNHTLFLALPFSAHAAYCSKLPCCCVQRWPHGEVQ
uniref:Uncharacterized protein n=1 Tax=Setaria viridis TaxID=4556 RepID=A0A4U6VPS7_SETVI|nr:hypothetical protein SEVIR_2G127900v2 [Setaria viridis]